MESSPQDETASDCRETGVKAGDDKTSPTKSFSRVISVCQIFVPSKRCLAKKGNSI